LGTGTRPDQTTLREAKPGDAEAVSALVTALAPFFLADPGDLEAAAPFLATFSPEAFRGNFASDRFRYHVAESNGELAGVVGVRDEQHLFHLFVAERFHRQGLAARLWTEARAAARTAGNPGRFTVNSSRYAIPVYERFGFRATGPEVHKDGVIFVPMALDEHGVSSRDVRRAGDRRP
jgi:GNAT superfamily N-acetyltransferase